MSGLTHVDADGRPTMVDVGDKPTTRRTAVAEARVQFPPEVAAQLRESGLRSAMRRRSSALGTTRSSFQPLQVPTSMYSMKRST